MKEYKRKTPQFSLCGLNCSLCPRFHTDGSSRCPGCGGDHFYEKHPSCAVISCSAKHGNIEYCFDCSEYPCKKYREPGGKDSFITYKHVQEDMKAASANLQKYLHALEFKEEILRELLETYNDGKMKNFYCVAVNLFPLGELEKIMEQIRRIKSTEVGAAKEAAQQAKKILLGAADKLGIDISLRK